MSLSNELTKAVRFALFAGVSAAVGLAGTTDAIAQQGSDTLETIVVTGSRIRSVDAETSQPVLMLDRADIEKQGLTSVAEVLQHVAANGAGINRTFNNGGDGSAGVSLRNLGESRTLVLVDGRRWVTSLGGSVDLNTIPAAIIERIEILKDGASSIYGSDAIAGVVNIITRDNYEGAEARFHYGEFQSEGDGERISVDATVGVGNDRGNVVVSVSRVEEKEVWGGDRAISRDPVYGMGRALDSGYGDSGKIWNGHPNYMTIRPGSTPTDGRYAEDQWVPFEDTVDGYNYAKDNYLLTPSTRTALYVKGRYDITDNISFRTDALYNERRSSQELAGYPLHGGPLFGDDVSVSGDSYFNPYNTAYGGSGEDITWSRRLTEAPRHYTQNVKTFHVYAGLEGNFQFADRYFNWDVGYAFNKSDQMDSEFGDANMISVAAGIGPSEMRDGQVVCVDAPGGNVIDGCVPFNPLVPAGEIPQDQLDYILFTAHDNYQNRNETITANLTGDIAELPGGMMGFAVGYENRRESGYDEPDALVQGGFTSGNAREATKGQYDLDEFYAEILVPVLADMPGAQLLEFSLASRYSDYSNFGDTTNSKFGFKWKPIEDLLVRGNIAEGFRAPSISTLYRGQADTYTNFGDICSADYPGRTPTIAANCASAGVPVDYLQFTNTGSGYSGQTVFPFTIGGNPNLGPETSTSKTLGMVYSPSYVSGLDVSLDYWNIKIKGGMSTPSAGFILDQCYGKGDQAYCGMFERRADGVIIDMQLVAQNMSVINMAGYDFNINYRMPETNFGSFRVNLDTSYVTKNESQASTTSPTNSYIGRYYEWDPNWRLRANASLDWTLGDFGVTWMSRYMSSLTEACDFPELCSDSNRTTEDGYSPRNKLGATTYHDLQVRYNAPWNGTIKVGANNLFKKDPPVAQQAFANSFDPQYDVPGRYLYVEYAQRF